MAPAFSPPPVSRCWYVLTLLLVVTLFFCNLGGGGIYAAQEGRTAIIARNMLRTGNGWEMQVPGGIPYEKPILHYWLVAASGAAFDIAGEPETVSYLEFAVRLPSALAALLAVLGVFLLARSIYGPRTALVAAAMLSTMATFNTLGRLAHIDMMLCASYVWALAGLYFGYLRERRTNWRIYGFYFFLALGMLLKGPLVVALAVLTILALMWRFRSWRWIFELRPWSGGALFLVLGGSWYVWETIRTDGAFFQEFVVNQNLRRFTGIGSTYRDGEHMSIFYYFPKLLAGALPWSLAAVAALVAWCRRFRRWRFRDETFFLAAWLVTGFLFFSASALKRGDYLLPIYPALAILTARATVLFCERRERLSSRWRILWTAVTALSLTALALAQAGLFRRLGERVLDGSIEWISHSDGAALVFYSDLVTAHPVGCLSALAVLLALLRLLLYWLEQGRRYPALALVIALVGALIVFYHTVVDPATDDRRSVKAFARTARQLIDPAERVLMFNSFNTELIFFLDREYEVGAGLREYDWVITTPRTMDIVEQVCPERFEVVLQTPEDHQYPAWLLHAR